MAVLKYYNTATSAWEYIAASTTANFTTWKKTATGGETSVSGTDDNAVTLSYTVGLEQVFINGVLQVRGTDYVATTGTSITGLTALVAGDIVTVICYAPFNVANTIAPTLVDAKGDLIVATAADTVGRLAVGTNNQLLAADSSTSTGLKWVNPGLTLITTSSFSGVSSQSLPTSTFTSTYTNYRLVCNIATSTSANLFLRLRASGTDNSNTNYGFQSSLFVTSTTYTRNSNISAIQLTANNSQGNYTFSLDILEPQVNGYTWVYGAGYIFLSNFLATGSLEANYQADSATFYPNTGNISGSINVFGYNK